MEILHLPGVMSVQMGFSANRPLNISVRTGYMISFFAFLVVDGVTHLPLSGSHFIGQSR